MVAVSEYNLISMQSVQKHAFKCCNNPITHTHTHIHHSVVVSTLGSQPRDPRFKAQALQDTWASLLMCNPLALSRYRIKLEGLWPSCPHVWCDLSPTQKLFNMNS